MTGEKEEIETTVSVNSKRSVRWHKSTWYNTTIVGLCQFLAPGLWNAMNSLGAGGLQDPVVVNTANAITFSLMFLTALFGSAIVRLIGVRNTLALGTVGYAPYSAALYCNSVYGTQWFVLFGAALCGLTAGIFWMVEAGILLSYPEPEVRAKQMSYWLCFRVGGQLVGGAINLGVSAHNTQKGSISPKIYIIFITLQALGPFVAYFLTPPDKVERRDGKKVQLAADKSFFGELISTLKYFANLDFVFLIPFFAATVWSEATSVTYIAEYFSVRARALGSFLSAICCMLSGYIEGILLDTKFWDNKTKKRSVYTGLAVIQGGIWVWSTINQQKYTQEKPTFDWSSPGFGRAFALYLFMAIGFQINYLFAFNIVGDIARTPAEIIRLAALVRGNESAAQAISYGLSSVESLITVGISAVNFGVWGISILPAGYVVWKFGTQKYSRDSTDPGVVEITTGNDELKDNTNHAKI